MIKFYEVGGCVRDELLQLESKDVDFVVIAPSFQAMEESLKQQGFKIFLSKPEFVTIRAAIPASHPLRSRTRDADFVLARKDGPSGDGRRPDYVEPGTLKDDLERRDFTVNALARDPETGSIIDYFGGQDDLKCKRLRFVGDPMARIKEDGLRVLRGFRFMITKGLDPAHLTEQALRSEEAATMLQCVSIERVREEVEKMFAFDTLRSVSLISSLPIPTREAIFRDGLRLSPSLKKL